MIRINLLPREHIVEPPTPVARIVSIAACALLVVVGAVVYIAGSSARAAKEQKWKQKLAKRKKLERSNIESRHREVTQLVGNLQKREKAIQEIQVLRTEMSRKLYQFAEVLNAGGHPVWLTSLEIEKAKERQRRLTAAQRRRLRRSRKKGQTTVKIPKFSWTSKAQCAGEKLTPAVNLFQAMIEDKEFYKDIAGTGVPNYKAIELPEVYEERVGFGFNLDMTIQLKRKIPTVKKPQRRRRTPTRNNRRNNRKRRSNT